MYLFIASSKIRTRLIAAIAMTILFLVGPMAYSKNSNTEHYPTGTEKLGPKKVGIKRFGYTPSGLNPKLLGIEKLGHTPSGIERSFFYNEYCPVDGGTLFFNMDQFDIAYESNATNVLSEFETILVEFVPGCAACRRIIFSTTSTNDQIYRADLIPITVRSPGIPLDANYLLDIYATLDDAPEVAVIEDSPCYERHLDLN